MALVPEKWTPRRRTFEIFKIDIATLQDLKDILGATSVSASHVRNGEIVVEWTMMHRETFFGLVGQYIVRNDRGEVQVLDKSELRSDYEPLIERPTPVQEYTHPEVGSIVGVQKDGDVPVEVLFRLPDGTPASFVAKPEKTLTNTDGSVESVKAEGKDDVKVENSAPKPNPGNQQHKKNDNRPNQGQKNNQE